MRARDTTMLTAQDVKERMQCSLSQAYRYIATMPNHFRRGRTVRVPKWAFEEWIASHLQNGESEELSVPARSSTKPPTSEPSTSFFDLASLPGTRKGKRNG